MQYRPGLIDGFLAKTGLDLTLSLPWPLKVTFTGGHALLPGSFGLLG